jgi:hypothetical protein
MKMFSNSNDLTSLSYSNISINLVVNTNEGLVIIISNIQGTTSRTRAVPINPDFNAILISLLTNPSNKEPSVKCTIIK